MAKAVKNIPINPKLSVKGCWAMVNKVDTLEKAAVAEQWLRGNDIIDNIQYNDLMMALSYIIRELHVIA